MKIEFACYFKSNVIGRMHPFIAFHGKQLMILSVFLTLQWIDKFYLKYFRMLLMDPVEVT